MIKTMLRILLLALVAFSLFAYFKLSFLVLPPVEPVSKGKTLVMWQDDKLGLLASPDSLCMTSSGSVNTVCRGTVILSYSQSDENVITELPYIQILQVLSTVGKD